MRITGLFTALALQLACTDARVRALEEENARLRADLERRAGAPDLARIARLVEDTGRQVTVEGPVIRSACAGPEAVALTVQIFPDPGVVYLATNGWLRLADTADERGVVVLLTQLAALNYETLLGKLQLNPVSGEVLLSLELEAHEGVSDGAVRDAVERLCLVAAELRPKLRAAIDQGLL